MDTVEMNDFLVKKVFDTEGNLEKQIENLVMEYDVHTRITVLKRYLYFKAYVLDQITHQVTMSAAAYDDYRGALHASYARYLENHRDELLAKHMDIDFNEMTVTLDRFEKTGFKVGDCRDIILRNLGVSLQDNKKVRSKLTRIMSKTFNEMRVSFTNEQEGNIFLSRKGYMAVMALAILCVIIALYYI